MVSKSVILVLQPVEEMNDYGILVAWASLQSIGRLRKNTYAPQYLSIIFKPLEDRQPWVLNLVIAKYEECTRCIIDNLTSLGVQHKAAKVKAQA